MESGDARENSRRACSKKAVYYYYAGLRTHKVGELPANVQAIIAAGGLEAWLAICWGRGRLAGENSSIGPIAHTEQGLIRSTG